jgi:thiosulfate/3-mercaptopyruvate sulfurtransferase
MAEPLPASLALPLLDAAHLSGADVGSAIEPVFVDCRFDLRDPDAGEASWRQARVPGSRYLHLDRDLSGPVTKGRTGRHPLPDADALRRRFAEIGVDADAPVVFLDDADGAMAARAWWLACWLGHPQAHVLDGGLRAWRAAGGAVEDTAPEEPRPAASWPIRAALLPVADASDVIGTFRTEHPLVDARAQQRFEGVQEPLDPIAGHIPGARCVPHGGNVDRDGRFLAEDALLDRWAPVLGDDAARAICYCGSGVTAAHNVLAIVAAGLPAPRLYVGSWSEWITDPSRPVASGPGTGVR